MLYHRPGEDRPPSNSAATFGVSVHTGTRRFFFPGGNPDAGLTLAGLVLSRAELDRADRIEFGERDGDRWFPREVLRNVHEPT